MFNLVFLRFDTLKIVLIREFIKLAEKSNWITWVDEGVRIFTYKQMIQITDILVKTIKMTRLLLHLMW